MRIGINATFLNSRPTGIGNFTTDIARRLCDLGDDVVVFSSQSVGNCKTVKTPLSMEGSERFINNLRRFFYINSLLPLLIRREGIDVLYCPILEFPFVPISGVLVVSLHDLHPLYFPEQFGLSAQYFRCSLKALSYMSKRIIVPSEFVKRELLRVCTLDDKKIRVVYNGYNEGLYTYGIVERGLCESELSIDRPYILFVGSLFEYKNVKTLVSAFLRIKDRIPHMLVVIGKKALAQRGLVTDDRIRYLDYVDLDLLPLYYSCADVYVHPSFFEGFGITLLEAMACGVPVISSRGGSLPEVGGDAAIYFNPYRDDELAEILLRVLSDKALRSEMVDKGLENVKRFSWDRAASEIQEICEEACRKG